jgi:hypothetical protein
MHAEKHGIHEEMKEDVNNLYFLDFDQDEPPLLLF